MGVFYDQELLVKSIDKKGDIARHANILRQAKETGRLFALDSP
jgi:hypothetical protein